ncbi:MAG: HAMP domain-containing methyl-accepting chemotaxis protein [bacterium]
MGNFKNLKDKPLVKKQILFLIIGVIASAALAYLGVSAGKDVFVLLGVILFAAALFVFFDCLKGIEKAEADTSVLENNMLELAIGISEMFESLNRLMVANDFSIRIPETASEDILVKLAALINKILDRLQESYNTTVDSRDYVHGKVDHLLEIMDAMKSGDLSARANIENGNDEIGRLCAGINSLIQNFQEMKEEMDNTNMDMALSLSENFEVLNKISAGDLTARVTPGTDNELLFKLGEVINSTMKNLRGLIEKMNVAARHIGNFTDEFIKSTDQVRQGAQQIAVSVQDMARGSENQSQNVMETSKILEGFLETINQIAKGAQDQAKGVEQTSLIVNEMSATIEMTVASLQKMIDVFRNSNATARNGKEAVAKAIDNITQLSATVEQSAEIVEKLGKSSKRISEITEVIDDIAEQTNLLALNAAIEAGRAGEHGKGFAVVAAEVRKLAERSVKATKQIAELIEGVQENTNQVVQGMRIGTQQVALGAKLGEEAKTALGEIMGVIETTDKEIQRVSGDLEKMVSQSQKIVESMDSVASVVEENTAATEEMAASSKQVEEAMRKVLSISQDNAAAAEEISASTEEQTAGINEISSSVESLSGMARELEDISTSFKL